MQTDLEIRQTVGHPHRSAVSGGKTSMDERVGKARDADQRSSHRREGEVDGCAGDHGTKMRRLWAHPRSTKWRDPGRRRKRVWKT